MESVNQTQPNSLKGNQILYKYRAEKDLCFLTCSHGTVPRSPVHYLDFNKWVSLHDKRDILLICRDTIQGAMSLKQLQSKSIRLRLQKYNVLEGTCTFLLFLQHMCARWHITISTSRGVSLSWNLAIYTNIRHFKHDAWINIFHLLFPPPSPHVSLNFSFFATRGVPCCGTLCTHRHVRILGISRSHVAPVHSYTITEIKIWHVFLFFFWLVQVFSTYQSMSHTSISSLCVSLAVTCFPHELIRWHTSDDHVFWVDTYGVSYDMSLTFNGNTCLRCVCCSYITSCDEVYSTCRPNLAHRSCTAPLQCHSDCMTWHWTCLTQL